VSCQDPAYIPKEVVNSKIITPCKECSFIGGGSKSALPGFTCSGCDAGYYLIGVLDVPSDPKFWGTGCAKCPSMCATCNQKKQCLSCPDGRVKVGYYVWSQSENGPWKCFYNFQRKLIFATTVLISGILFCLFTCKWGLARVKDIERVFITQNVQQNYINPADLFQVPGQQVNQTHVAPLTNTLA
jgi:hypothetical protein